MLTGDKMNFFAPTEMGKTRRITNEGFLVCEGVAIARTGQQVYTDQELALDGNSDGQIIVDRIDDEVFREETLASFEGKPVTVEHPDEFVNPSNWKVHSVGVTQNVRRGEGIENDLILADLLITDVDAIAYVNRDLPELSAGYSSDYDQQEAGKAIQRNIIGNHIALVTRGRAGPRCSIRDQEPFVMKSKLAQTVARLFTAIQAKDEAAVNTILTQDDDDDTMDARIAKAVGDALDARDAAAKQKKDKEDQEAKDMILAAEAATKIASLGTLYTGDSLKQILSRAEILAPGIQLPTADAEASSAVPALMLKALTTADGTEVGKIAIEPFLLGRKLSELSTADVLGVFNGAAELMRLSNNKSTAKSVLSTKDFGKTVSVADMNAAAAVFWAKQVS